MWIRIGALLVCGAILTACADDQMNGSDRQDMRTSDRQGSVSKSDMEWVKTAASSGLFEVESSQLAVQRAMDDSGTRQFAQRMITEHTQANQELKALAQRKNIALSNTLMDRHQKMLDKLREADADNFAREYHAAQRVAHAEAVSHFEKGERDLEDAELKAYATRTLPVLKDHMKSLKEHEH
jgi:putative membrane protein